MKALVGALNQEKALVKYCESMKLTRVVSVQGLVHAYKIFAFRCACRICARKTRSRKTTGNGIIFMSLSSSHWPIFKKLYPDQYIALM